MARTLKVTCEGRDYRFAPGSTVRVGRAPDADIQIDNPTVGRLHAVLRVDGDEWVLDDGGTFERLAVDGRSVGRITISDAVTVVLGPPGSGVTLRLVPEAGTGGLTPPTGAEAVPPAPARPAVVAPPPPPVTEPPFRAGVGVTEPPFRGGVGVTEPPMRPGGSALRGSITVVNEGREQTFPPGSPVRIGRDADNDIVINHPRVSRHHAVLKFVGTGWVVEDAGSSGGTLVDGAPPANVALRGPAQVLLGGAPGGAALLVRPDLGIGPMAPTDPGVALGATDTGTGSKVRVRAGGRDYVFAAGQIAVFGRDPSSDVVVDRPAVSRRHAVLRHDGQDWVLEDSGSTRGITVAGKQVPRAVINGTVTAWLGPEGDGEQVVLTAGSAGAAGGSTGRKLSKSMLVVAGVAVAAVLAAVLFFVTRDGGSGASTASLDTQKLATVRVIAETATGRSSGSGTVISADGLIVTNAHVAAPAAPGAGISMFENDGTIINDFDYRNPDFLLIELADEPDGRVRPRYRAEVLAVDGYLDVAVLQIYATDDGARVDPGDLSLPFVPVGDSDAMELGDKMTVLGYPGIDRSDRALVTEVTLGNFSLEQRIGVERSWFVTSEPIRSGNSGGLAADANGRLVAIPTAKDRLVNEAPLSYFRPINLALPVIEAARAARDGVDAGGEEGDEEDDGPDEYLSPYVGHLTGDEAFESVAFGDPSVLPDNGPCTYSSYTSYSGQVQRIAAEFTFEGMTPGIDVAALVLAGGSISELTEAVRWSREEGESGCYAFVLESAEPLPPGEYTVIVVAGPNFEATLASATLTIV